MLKGLSRLHSFWAELFVKRKQLLLITGITMVLVITAASGATYYLANYSANLPSEEQKQSQVLESRSIPDGNREATSSSDTTNVKGVQAGKEEVGVSKPTLTPTYTTPSAVNPTTAPVQNYQTPVYIYQPQTSDSNSYSYPSPTDDWYTERLHQMQEQGAKRTEYCNQVRDQRSAAVAPYMAKRTEVNNQMIDAIQKRDMELYRSLEKQYNEADKEFWNVYNSFDTSCV